MKTMQSISGAAAVAVASLGLVACGSSAPSNSASDAKASTQLAYAQCMRAHGVPNFPDPGSNGRGGLLIQQSQRAGSGPSMKVNGVSVSAPAFQAAMRTCRSKLPNGGRPQPLSASQRQAMLGFSHCMRAHGLTNFPDPTFGADGSVGIRFSPGSGLNKGSPAFQSAQKACASFQNKGFGVATGP